MTYNVPQSSFLDEKDFQQAQLYAKELHDLYQAERKKREELAEEKLVLEYKLRELSALNILFQGYLERREDVEKAFDYLVEGLEKLLTEIPSRRRTKELKKLLLQAEAERAKLRGSST